MQHGLPRLMRARWRSLQSWAATGWSGPHRDENAAAAGMEWRHRLEVGFYLAPVEWVACWTASPSILSLDSGPDPPASVVCPDRGPLGQHLEPLLKQDEFP
jgi:hypothetical protein